MKHHGRVQFLRATALFAEAFARTLPLVFGPFIVQRITSHNWHNAGERGRRGGVWTRGTLLMAVPALPLRVHHARFHRTPSTLHHRRHNPRRPGHVPQRSAGARRRA